METSTKKDNQNSSFDNLFTLIENAIKDEDFQLLGDKLSDLSDVVKDISTQAEAERIALFLEKKSSDIDSIEKKVNKDNKKAYSNILFC